MLYHSTVFTEIKLPEPKVTPFDLHIEYYFAELTTLLKHINLRETTEQLIQMEQLRLGALRKPIIVWCYHEKRETTLTHSIEKNYQLRLNCKYNYTPPIPDRPQFILAMSHDRPKIAEYTLPQKSTIDTQLEIMWVYLFSFYSVL